MGDGDDDEDDDELNLWLFGHCHRLASSTVIAGRCRSSRVLGVVNGSLAEIVYRQLHHGQCLAAVLRDDEHANDDVQGRVRTKTVKRASRVLIEK